MKCKKIQHLINMYADNELPGQTRSVVQGHIAGCEKCAHTLNEITKLKEIIGAAVPYPVNPFLWTRIASGIREEMPIPTGVLIPKILRIWVPIASVLIILTGIFMHNLPEQEKPVYDKGTLTTIMDMPIIPENMEKITLNLLVYANGILKEVPHVKL